jgi:hypothetical protein
VTLNGWASGSCRTAMSSTCPPASCTARGRDRGDRGHTDAGYCLCKRHAVKEPPAQRICKRCSRRAAAARHERPHPHAARPKAVRCVTEPIRSCRWGSGAGRVGLRRLGTVGSRTSGGASVG